MANNFYFSLDKENFEKLDWGHVATGGDSGRPTLTDEQAKIIAIAGIASALQNIAYQLTQALEPLEMIADALQVKGGGK